MEFTVLGLQMRLDQFLTEELNAQSDREQYSRAMVQRWIRQGAVRVFSNGQELPQKKVKPSLLIEAGNVVRVKIPEEETVKLPAAPVDFTVLFEDDHLAVIIKPAGISVHPGPGESGGTTLLHGLLHHWPVIRSVDSHQSGRRPGIVHRLDRPTEGVMVVAKTSQMQWQLSRLFQLRKVEKRYLAWLNGSPDAPEGRIEEPLRRHPTDRMRMQVHKDGRPAITEFRVLDYRISRKGRKFTKVDVNLLTGRTHQIRAHFAHLKCAVVGDELYSHSAREFSRFGLLLLSRSLSFEHPVTGKWMSFEAPVPARFMEFEEKCIFF